MRDGVMGSLSDLSTVFLGSAIFVTLSVASLAVLLFFSRRKRKAKQLLSDKRWRDLKDSGKLD